MAFWYDKKRNITKLLLILMSHRKSLRSQRRNEYAPLNVEVFSTNDVIQPTSKRNDER